MVTVYSVVTMIEESLLFGFASQKKGYVKGRVRIGLQPKSMYKVSLGKSRTEETSVNIIQNLIISESLKAYCIL
jgi:hypothetical protein